jgi:hypothetical protein
MLPDRKNHFPLGHIIEIFKAGNEQSMNNPVFIDRIF